MARSDELNTQMREASRSRILRTALRLFARQGYHGTSIRMIAAGAGISLGLLYNYFPSKRRVLIAIFEQSIRDVQDSFDLAEAAGSPADRIGALVRGAFTIVRNNQDFWRLSYAVRMQPGVIAGLGKRLDDWTSAIRSTLTRYLREAGSGEPRLEAELLFAIIDGESQHYMLDPRGYPVDDVAALVERLFRSRRRAGARR